MKLDDGFQRPRRRMNLTPMIDVVFLLLVFFMMVSRFGGQHGLPLQVAGPGGGAWVGPPRLVDIAADATRLNGVAVTDVAAALRPLMAAPDDPVILRADGADVQALVVVIEGLRAAGITHLVMVE
jgi:biopolymer transport protein ExbD